MESHAETYRVKACLVNLSSLLVAYALMLCVCVSGAGCKKSTEESARENPSGQQAGDSQSPLTDKQAMMLVAADQTIRQAMAYLEADEYMKALNTFRIALALWKDIPDSRKPVAICHDGSGRALLMLGRMDEGIKELEEALAIYTTLPGTEERQAVCRKLITVAQNGQGAKRRAASSSSTTFSVPEFRAIIFVHAGLAWKAFAEVEGTHGLPDERRLAEFIGRVAVLENMHDAYQRGQFKWRNDELGELLRRTVECNRSFLAIWEGRVRRHLAEADDLQNEAAQQRTSKYQQALRNMTVLSEDMTHVISENPDDPRDDALSVLEKQSFLTYAEPSPKIYAGVNWLFLPHQQMNNPGEPEKWTLAYLTAVHWHLASRLKPWEISPDDAAIPVSFLNTQLDEMDLSGVRDKGRRSGLEALSKALRQRCAYRLRNRPTRPDLGDSMLDAAAEMQIVEAADRMGVTNSELDSYGFGVLAIGDLRKVNRALEGMIGKKGTTTASMPLEKGPAEQRPEPATTPSGGRDPTQVRELLGEGIALALQYRSEQALAVFQTALQVAEESPKLKLEEALCHQSIGMAMDDLLRHEEAIAELGRAKTVFSGLPDTGVPQALCSLRMGMALGDMGQYEASLAMLREALQAYSEIPGSDDCQALCWKNIAVTSMGAGLVEQGIEDMQEALRIYERLPHTDQAQAECYHNIGTALYRLGRYQDSLRSFDKALALYSEVPGSQIGQSKTKGMKARALVGIGEFQKASAEIEDVLRVAHGWWVYDAAADAEEGIGGKDHLSDALRYRLKGVFLVELTRSYIRASENQTSWFEEKAGTYERLVTLLIRMGREKVKAEQSDLPQLGSMPEEIAFHYADRGKGRALVDALRERAALKSSRPDAKLLAEDKELSLRISKLTALRDQPAPDSLEQSRKLTQEIESLQQQRNTIEAELKRTALGSYVAPEFHKPMDMAKELSADTAVLQYSVGEKEGWLLILTHEGVTAHKLGAQVSALPELLPRQQATSAQLVEAWKKRPENMGLDGLVRVARVRVEDLGRDKAQRQGLVDEGQEKAILEWLGAVILPESALTELRQKKIRHLLVIPDGSLYYVPFAMLRLKGGAEDKSQYLIEEFAVSYTPAMTTLDTIRKQKAEREQKRRGPRRELLAFANPDFGQGALPVKDDMVTRLRGFRNNYYTEGGLRLTVLPETEKEAMQVASLFGPPRQYGTPTTDDPEGTAVVYTGKGACEEQVKRLLGPGGNRPGWRTIVFSTHGLADVRNGMLSCLALSTPGPDSEEDGFLQAQEVMGLDLDTDLVMLSACQTGLGRIRGGEGFVGLTTAFFYAGAESVCASSWQVPSGPTGELVTQFFRNLKDGKLSRPEALRAAQLSILKRAGQYVDPFYWGAWQLYGEWRTPVVRE